MRKQLVALLVSICSLSVTSQAEIIETFGTGTNTFNMIFVPIGNPGNAADGTGSPNPAGSVSYVYNIGKYEVSRDMIIKANAEGGLRITLFDHASIGMPSGNGANRPATGISWNEAARYVNWLNTSQGYSPAYKFDVQPGQPGYNAVANITLWQANDQGYNAANLFRNSQARYFLPSSDEWYKAAYHKNDGVTGNYWNYPTGSDLSPMAVGGGTAAGTAVYSQPFNQGPADIDNAGGLSPYMVMGMGGNVYELQESEWDMVNDNPSSVRSVRGGLYNIADYNMSASYRVWDDPWDPQFETMNSGLGFRVASIPEPSSAALSMLATVGLWQRRKRSS